jgi:hypothetical protein
MDELGERSFGLTLLGMAVVALVPGASTFVGLLIAWPSIQLILGHEAAVDLDDARPGAHDPARVWGGAQLDRAEIAGASSRRR